MGSRLFSSASGDKGVFLDERFLYPEFIPEKLLFREKEISSLVYCFEPLLRARKPLNVFLSGPTGVGKTVCVKHVLKELQESSDRAKSIYLNCFEFNSRVSVLIALANFLGAGIPRRGLATDEVFSSMVGSLRRSSFTPIVVLDEVDQLLVSDAEAKLLYDLLRVVEYEKLRIGVVMISNDTALTAKLDSRIRSSLAEQAIVFEPYTPMQLKQILSERAELAFSKGVLEKDVIGVAAAHAGRLGGDARVAIESLLKAGRIAERKGGGNVAVEDLRKAFEDSEAVSLLKGIRHLEKNELGLLRIIAENQPLNSGKIYSLCSGSGGNGLKERTLRGLLANLEKHGLVSSKEMSLGNRGKTREYSCRAPKQAVLREISKIV